LTVLNNPLADNRERSCLCQKELQETTGKGVAFVSAVKPLIGAERQRMDNINWLKLRMRKNCYWLESHRSNGRATGGNGRIGITHA
jgi:hypothetical protein